MKKIVFNEKFDCIVCLDGEIPNRNIFNELDNIPVFAADGAVFKLDKINIHADKIIGDLDTFNRSAEKINYSKSKLVYCEDQNTNDFEKVLNYAINLGFKNCLILGINGGEFEHTLNNWSVFAKYSNILNLCILTENRYGFKIDSDIKINLNTDEIVSLVPQPKAIVTTKNLNWNLFEDELELGKREGARNFATHEKVSIYVHKGELLIFINQRLPFVPQST